MIEGEQLENHTDDLERQRNRRLMRIPAWGLGITGAVLIIFAQEGIGSEYLAVAGRAVLWSGSIFLPLIFLNRDLYARYTARFLTLILLLVQGILIAAFSRYLKDLPILALFPVCAVQVMIFEIPFLMLRKRLGQ